MFGLTLFKNEEYTLHLGLLGSHTLRSLQMVYQWTEEISIGTKGAIRKASLTNSDLLPMVPLVRVP